jgi:hypothetical protein
MGSKTDHRPVGLRKSGIPLSTEIPAPDKATARPAVRRASPARATAFTGGVYPLIDGDAARVVSWVDPERSGGVAGFFGGWR